MISSLLELSFPTNVHIQAFADDITLVIAGKTRLHIETLANKTLHMIHTWSTQHHITFNPSKCNFILIGNHYLKRPPTIKLGNHNIRHTHELKILGIIFDHKLSFIPHATYLRDKIYKHTIALSLFSGIHWGFSPRHFRDLYTRSLERIITYGAPVFFSPTPNSHLMRKLTSIQRIPLLKICKAFTTVSNASINILTNILPIEYTLNREIALFNIFQLKQSYTLYETTYDPTQIQHHIDIWDTHPAHLLSFPFASNTNPSHQRSNETTHNIYTDGSLLNETVGAAFAIFDKLQQMITYKMYKLPSFISIYEAELQAIKQALICAAAFPREDRFTLFSDSHSALQAIANPYNIHPTVQEIKELLQTLNTTHSIQLIHIRSHTNIHGNDIADHLANTSRHAGTPLTPFPNKQHIRKQIRQQQLKLWNTNWRENHSTTPVF
uniref:Putative reverse transcriptase n=1 Tax=Ixodes ricinus TaxID=34613 RepID=A0A131Y6M1_IXORI